MAIQLVSDIKKAKHFTSHEARFAAIDALREAHGLEASPLYSYVTVRAFGALLFVSTIED